MDSLYVQAELKEEEDDGVRWEKEGGCFCSRLMGYPRVGKVETYKKKRKGVNFTRGLEHRLGHREPYRVPDNNIFRLDIKQLTHLSWISGQQTDAADVFMF